MNFKEQYNSTKVKVEKELLYFIEKKKEKKQDIIYQAMEYSLNAGGKRFRPVLHLETIRLLGGNPEDYMDSACALEYIHTYSLLHDDLPAMDNDDFRRGVPTNHKVFGEDIAILAGDGLLNTAFEILLQKTVDSRDEAVAEGSLYISRKAGTEGMIGGQVVDVISDGKQIDMGTLEYIHERKTAALIEAAIVSAAIMMKCRPEERQALEVYASKLGLAFQIADDILDVEGSFEELGKPIGSDAENQKLTFASYYGLDKAKEKLQQVVEEAIHALSVFDKKDFFVELTKYTATRRS